MADNYRQCIDHIKRVDSTHAGLWLDKYMPDHVAGTGQKLVEEVANIPVPEAYRSFFKRWQREVQALCVVPPKKATVKGRLSVGLGGESVMETAITLHHTYGVPYIPGSALKGLAARYARNRLDPETWGVQSNAYQTMFGDTMSAGYLTFFDALYAPPAKPQQGPLWPDVITVHHPNYYQGSEPPADWDSPTPVSFLSATGDYLIAIGGDAAWANAAFEILDYALREEGIGAKTTSGYGRMTIEGMSTAPVLVSTQTASAPAAASIPTLVRRGVIVEIQPWKHLGRVRDNETNEEYKFSTDVIEGNFPAKKGSVEFSLQGNQIVKVKRV